MRLELPPIGEQVIVITGASSGIGLVTAKQAAERGARVVLARPQRRGPRRARSRRFGTRAGEPIHVDADVADPEQVEAIADAAIARVRPHRHVGQQRRRVDVRTDHGAVDRRHAPADGHQFLGPGLRVSRRRATPARSWRRAHQRRQRVVRPRDPAAGDLLRGQARDEGIHRHPPDGTRGRGGADVGDTRQAGEHRHTVLREGANLLGVEPQPVPPVYAPEVVAGVILHAAQHPLRELIAGGSGAKLSARGSFRGWRTGTWSAGRSMSQKTDISTTPRAAATISTRPWKPTAGSGAATGCGHTRGVQRLYQGDAAPGCRGGHRRGHDLALAGAAWRVFGRRSDRSRTPAIWNLGYPEPVPFPGSPYL